MVVQSKPSAAEVFTHSERGPGRDGNIKATPCERNNPNINETATNGEHRMEDIAEPTALALGDLRMQLVSGDPIGLRTM